MSRLYPGHTRRMRRVRTACILGVLGLIVACVVELWPRDTPVSTELPWLLPLLVVSAIVLALTCIVLLMSVMRELKRLGPRRPEEDYGAARDEQC
jgi:hypothetical protein